MWADFWLGSVSSPEYPLSGEQRHPYSHRPSHNVMATARVRARLPRRVHAPTHPDTWRAAPPQLVTVHGARRGSRSLGKAMRCHRYSFYTTPHPPKRQTRQAVLGLGAT